MASTWYTFTATILRQREDAPDIALFSADAYWIRDFATVSRKGEDPDGYQRLLNPRKVNAIAKYVDAPQSLLPTAVVLAAGKNSPSIRVLKKRKIKAKKDQWTAEIRIRAGESKKPCLIIDGQHRVFGVVGSMRESYQLPVCLLLGADLVTQLLHFFIINNKTTRIRANLINELLGDLARLTRDDQRRLNQLIMQLGVESIDTPALVAELNTPGMVFHGILDFQSNKTPLVSSASLSRVVELSKQQGVLSHIDDPDAQIDALNYMWEGVRVAFAHRWEQEVGMLEKALANKAAGLATSKAEGTRASTRKGDRGKKVPPITLREFNRNKRLFHSGTIRVVGEVIDRELCAAPMRRKWYVGLRNPKELAIIRTLVAKEILGGVPKAFWEQARIDNTTKGREAFGKSFQNAIIGDPSR